MLSSASEACSAFEELPRVDIECSIGANSKKQLLPKLFRTLLIVVHLEQVES